MQGHGARGTGHRGAGRRGGRASGAGRKHGARGPSSEPGVSPASAMAPCAPPRTSFPLQTGASRPLNALAGAPLCSHRLCGEPTSVPTTGHAKSAFPQAAQGAVSNWEVHASLRCRCDTCKAGQRSPGTGCGSSVTKRTRTAFASSPRPDHARPTSHHDCTGTPGSAHTQWHPFPKLRRLRSPSLGHPQIWCLRHPGSQMASVFTWWKRQGVELSGSLLQGPRSCWGRLRPHSLTSPQAQPPDAITSGLSFRHVSCGDTDV